MENKDLRNVFCEIKAEGYSDEGHGSVTGYGAVKGNVDWYSDKILDGAFTNLSGLVNDGFAGESHKTGFLDSIGTIKSAREDANGLLVTMEFHKTAKAQECRQIAKDRIERGKSIGLSIGYFATQWEMADEGGKEVRLLKAVEVFEVSLVNMPANPLALVTSVKAGDRGSRAEQFDNALGVLSDALVRIDELKENRSDDWKKARVLELEDLIQSATSLKGSLCESPTTQVATPDADAILANAMKWL